MAIIDPKNGRVEFARVFDTYETSDGFDEFLEAEKDMIKEGHIVIAACKDECRFLLSEDPAKKWFQDMGSEEIRNFKWVNGFVFIGIFGRK